SILKVLRIMQHCSGSRNDVRKASPRKRSGVKSQLKKYNPSPNWGIASILKVLRIMQQCSGSRNDVRNASPFQNTQICLGLAMTFIKGPSLRGVNECRTLGGFHTPKQAPCSEAE